MWVYFKAAQPNLKLRSPIQFHLSLVKGHSRSTKSLVTAWDLGWKRNWMPATDRGMGSLSLISPSFLTAGLPNKFSEMKPSHGANKKQIQVCIQGPAHALMWSAPQLLQIPSPIRQNGGGNAPLNTTAQSVLNTKQDVIKWMHSGFYEGHCNIFLYYSLGLRDAYPTTKESQGLKITVLHYHQSTKKKLYINQLNWYVSKRATCKK